MRNYQEHLSKKNPLEQRISGKAAGKAAALGGYNRTLFLEDFKFPIYKNAYNEAYDIYAVSSPEEQAQRRRDAGRKRHAYRKKVTSQQSQFTNELWVLKPHTENSTALHSAPYLFEDSVENDNAEGISRKKNRLESTELSQKLPENSSCSFFMKNLGVYPLSSANDYYQTLNLQQLSHQGTLAISEELHHNFTTINDEIVEDLIPFPSSDFGAFMSTDSSISLLDASKAPRPLVEAHQLDRITGRSMRFFENGRQSSPSDSPIDEQYDYFTKCV